MSNGYSFLRMHRPDAYGDPLADIRPMIRQITKEHKFISGYEVGVNDDGFRYIFPLFYNNTYIGSVETSVPLLTFVNFFSNEYKSEFTVLYRGDALTPIKKSIFDKNFKKLSDTDFYLNNNLPNHILDEYAIKIIKENIDLLNYQDKSFVINFQENGKMCSLIFLPINEINGQNVGYVVKYVDSPELKIMKMDLYYKIIFSLFIFVTITTFILFIMLKNKKLSKEINLRKDIQSKLEDINKRFEIVIKSSGQIIYDYDVEQNQIKRFGAIQETLGYSEEELASGDFNNFKSCYHPDDVENIENFISKLISEKGKGQIIYRFKRKDGTYATFQDEATFIHFGNKPHIFGVMKDITEKIAIEEHLKRTQQLEAIGVLAGGIAHDFNNYLTGVYNYLEVLKHSCQDPKVDTISTKIQNTLDRAKSLTTQLLTFSKGGDPVIKVFNIKNLINTIADFSLSGSSLKYEVISDNDLLCCKGDENQIGQVIENILINARQAVKSNGQIKIVIKNLSKDKAVKLFNNPDLKKENYILITISDTGKGIPKEDMDKIFQPFFTTKDKGHGLGLSIAYSILKKHGGGIKVESKLNEGTTFYVLLEGTLEKCDLNKTDREIKSDKKLNILIMDDEEEILDSLSQLIEIFGHNVFCAKNGEEALELYKKHKGEIDLCILDITIKGGMGGIETIKKLLEIDNNVKAIVSSGYSDDEVMAHPEKYGFWGTLQKPFKVEEITKILKNIK